MANPFDRSPLGALADEWEGERRTRLPSIERAAPAPAAARGLNIEAPQAQAPSDTRAPAVRQPRTGGKIAPPQNLAPAFVDAARRHGVPVNVLAAIADQESSFNDKAVGVPTQWGRAKGLMQYLDSTASALGINPFDPVQSIDAAAKQLRERLDKGYSMVDAVREHFAGPDRRQWGPKTERYGLEVLDRAGRVDLDALIPPGFGGVTGAVDSTERTGEQADRPAADPSSGLSFQAAPKRGFLDELGAAAQTVIGRTGVGGEDNRPLIARIEDAAGRVVDAITPDAFQSGRRRGKQGFMAATGGLMPESVYGPEGDRAATAAVIANLEREAARYPQDEERQKALVKIVEAEGFGEAARAIVQNPGAVVDVVLESLGVAAPQMAATGVAGAAGGPVATALGAGTGSFSTEYAQSILEAVQKDAGGDLTNVHDISRALGNPELMAKARERGIKRGIPIALFDMLTAGLAGQLLRRARGVGQGVAATAGEMGVQAAGGMAGETAAGLWADGEIKPGEILLEGIAEIPTAAIEVPANLLQARRQGLEADALRDTGVEPPVPGGDVPQGNAIPTPPQGPPPSVNPVTGNPAGPLQKAAERVQQAQPVIQAAGEQVARSTAGSVQRAQLEIPGEGVSEQVTIVAQDEAGTLVRTDGGQELMIPHGDPEATVRPLSEADTVTAEPVSDTLAQIRAIRDPSSGKDTALVTPNSEIPGGALDPLLDGLTVVETNQGLLVTSNPEKAAAIEAAGGQLTTDQIGQLLGYTTRKGETDGAVVQATDAAGNVVHEEATNAANLEAAAARAEEMAPDGGQVQVTDAVEALARREEAVEAEQAPAPNAAQRTPADMTEPELRARLKYLRGQARVIGWTSALIEEGSAIEAEIDRRNAEETTTDDALGQQEPVRDERVGGAEAAAPAGAGQPRGSEGDAGGAAQRPGGAEAPAPALPAPVPGAGATGDAQPALSDGGEASPAKSRTTPAEAWGRIKAERNLAQYHELSGGAKRAYADAVQVALGGHPFKAMEYGSENLSYAMDGYALGERLRHEYMSAPEKRPAAPPVSDYPITEHTTGKGKVLRGTVRTDLTDKQARQVDPYTFKKDGGWFIRERDFEKLRAFDAEQTLAAQAEPPREDQQEDPWRAAMNEALQTIPADHPMRRKWVANARNGLRSEGDRASTLAQVRAAAAPAPEPGTTPAVVADEDIMAPAPRAPRPDREAALADLRQAMQGSSRPVAGTVWYWAPGGRWTDGERTISAEQLADAMAAGTDPAGVDAIDGEFTEVAPDRPALPAPEAVAPAALIPPDGETPNYQFGWGEFTRGKPRQKPQFLQFAGDRDKRVLDFLRGWDDAKAAADRATPSAAPAETASADRFANNKIFTADKVEAARARLRSKLNQLNSGIDPEVLVDGMTIAGAYIESGTRAFADYASAMVGDFGDAVKPYLLSFYEAARNYPGVVTEGMSSVDDARAQHQALIGATPPASEAVGEIVPKPARRPRKTGKAGDRTLEQDFGVEHIDAYTQEGEETKAAFLKDARGYLGEVAKILTERGFSPATIRQGRPIKPVSVNEGGVAGSGEVSLTMAGPDGLGVFAQIGGSSLRGVVPTTPSGVSILFRAAPANDPYGSTGGNQWAPTDLTASALADLITNHVERHVRATAPKEQRHEPEQRQPSTEQNDRAEQDQRGVPSADRSGVPDAPGGRGDAAQPGSAPADRGELEAGQPEDVGSPATGGAGQEAGVRGPAADVAGAGRAGEGGDVGTRRPGAGGAQPPDAGARKPAGGGGQPARPEVAGPVDPETVSPANPGAGNFHIDNPMEVVGGGQVARFNKNKAAIEKFIELRDEGRKATREEQEILAGYTGWGSFGQELFQGTWARPQPKAGWEARDQWLRDHLGKAEWEGMQRSITNAHYTDPPTVMAMWDMVRRMGFAGGRVLEPSMGIGNFFGMMPADLKDRSQLAGIELDPVTGGMAQMLYPDAAIKVMGYQESKTPDDFYDLVIGNWPFENTPIADRRYNRLNPMLHDYFFLKTLDQVRPGGIVIGITSAGSMDKKGAAIRRELAKKAELVASFRLPSGAFEAYAGTKVVTDIIILRKRPEPIANVDAEGWVETVEMPTRAGTPVRVNAYYQANPQNVVGTIDYGHGTTTFRPGLIVHRPADMEAQLRRIVDMVPEGALLPATRPDAVSYIANHTSDREGALTRTDNALFIVRGEHLAPANEVVKYQVKSEKETAAREAQLDALIDMRRTYGQLIEAERGTAGVDPEPIRKGLRKAYQDFTKAHGPLTESFGLKYLSRIDDPFFYSLAALEIEQDGKYRPADILSRSTMRAPTRIENPSIRDAFVLARNRYTNPSAEQIAEFAGKPAAEVRAELIDAGAVFETPAGDIVPSDIYLSGNVREKLRQAEAALAEGNPAMQKNVDALRDALPADVPYFNIEVQLGASWVPTRAYEQFIAHMLNRSSTDGIEVSYTQGRWSARIDRALQNTTEAATGFGTPHYRFGKLVNAALGNQTVTIKRRDSDGTEYVDTEATAEANAKIADMREKFGEWLWSDAERRVEIEREYNEVRNAYASPKFDGSFLSFEGMALSLGRGPFDLRQHQANAIWRAIVTRRSLNAHEVGTGKTFTMGGIAVESRRYGIARKPMILAHNANSKSVAAEIQMMYPAAKILYLDNLSRGTIDVKMRQIANDDWDAIVVPHSLIERLTFREETLMAMAREEIEALEAEARLAASEDGASLTDEMLEDPEELKKLRSPTAKELVKARNRIIESIKKQAQQSSREGAVPFEELGIDMVLVDEAHEFKKPPIATRMKMKGLQTQTSQGSIQLNFITRYIRGQNNGGNVHLFTGTPITNTLTEIFHQMRYIMAEEMAQVGIDQWDGWFGSFAKEVQDVELTAAGEYETTNRLRGFINVPELRKMIGQYMDVVFSDDMPEMQPRQTSTGKTLAAPDLTEAERAQLLNGRTEGAKDRPYKKVVNETSDPTPEQMRIFAEVQALAAEWRDMGGLARKQAMQAGLPVVPIMYEQIAARASFDARMVRDEELAGQEGKVPDDPNSKISRAIKNLVEIYNSDSRAAQVVFTNTGLGTTASRALRNASGATIRDGDGKTVRQTVKVFSPIRDMVERLVQQGIPRDEIAIVDGSTSKDKRKEVADAMNAGTIRIVIGSTDSLGVGVNMQRNLRAMHHLDAPWMPGDLEQRNGRGHRQGNQWNTVLEYRYITDRIDGRRWQVLAIKQKFITDFLKADGSVRVIEGDAAADEESDILSTFAEAAGDPRVQIRQKLRGQLEQLQRRERMHAAGVADARTGIRRQTEQLEKARQRVAAIDRGGVDQKVADAVAANAGDRFTIELDGRPYTARKDATEALAKWVSANMRTGVRDEPVGRYAGHPVTASWGTLAEEPSLTITVGGVQITSGRATIASLEATLRNYGETVAHLRQDVEAIQSTIARLEEVAAQPFQRADELARVARQLEQLEADLAANPVPPPSWLRSGAPVDTDVVWNGTTFTVTGHRWNAEGWFVTAQDEAGGEVVIPYAEARDAQGMAIYDERPFEAPVIHERKSGEGDAAPAQPLRDIPDTVIDSSIPGQRRLPALSRLRSLRRRYQQGEIDAETFAREVSALTDAMGEQRQQQRMDRALADRARGADWVRERLLRARRQGELAEETATFGLWLLDRNPQLAEGLAIGIRGGGESSGAYNPAADLATIFRDNANDGTVVHEILHHAERMMPPAAQEGIIRAHAQAWLRAFERAADERLFLALADMRAASLGDGEAYRRVLRAFEDGTLDYRRHYPLVNASEFWAVNATEILAGRHGASGSWLGQARRFVAEVIEWAKSALGLPSNAAVLRGLRKVLNGNGERLSEQMLSERARGGRGRNRPGTLRDIPDETQDSPGGDTIASARSNKVGEPSPPTTASPLDASREQIGYRRPGTYSTETPEFRRWFGDSKVVDAQGRPLVVYHGTKANFDIFSTPAYFSESAVEASAYTEYGTMAKRQRELKRRRYVEESGAEYAGTRLPVASIFADADVGVVSYTDQGIGRRNRDGTVTILTDLVHVANSYDPAEGGSIKVRRGNGREFYRAQLREQREMIDRNWPESAGVGGNVMPVYLSIQNPKRMSPTMANRFGERLGGTQEQWAAAVAELEAQGYDGIVTESDDPGFWMNDEAQPQQWIPLRPEQIKSATGNRGTFDPADPRIDRAEGWTQVDGEVGEVQATLDAALATGGVEGAGQLLDGLATMDSLDPDQRWLAGKLAPLVRELGVKLVPAPNLKRAGNWGGVYMRETNSMAIRVPAAMTVLHEALHGVTSNLLDHKASRANAQVRQLVSDFDEMLEGVRAHLRENTDAPMDARVRHLTQVDGGPLSNIQELLAYGMTERPFQRWLATIPAPPSRRTLSSMWDAFKGSIGKLLGRPSGSQRTMLDAVIEATADLVDFQAANPAVGRLANLSAAARRGVADRAAVDKTRTPAFKRWFGDSKVVDASGEPLVVYHGSGYSFDEFVGDHAGAGWFARNPGDAARYSTQRDQGEPQTYAVYLSIKNPLVLDFDMNDSIEAATEVIEELGLSVEGDFGWANRAWEAVNTELFADFAAEAGYDGIRVDEGGNETWNAFSPEQIKSATGNDGGFDPNDPRIDRQEAPDGDPGPAPDIDLASLKLDRKPLSEAIGGALTTLKKNVWLPMVPLNYLTDYARAGMDAVRGYLDVKRQMDAYRGEKHAQYDAHARGWVEWAAKNVKASAELSALMHDSTIAQLDPSMPLPAPPAGQEQDAALVKRYEALRARYDALPAEGRKLYRQTRDLYQAQAAELDQIIEDNIARQLDIARDRATEAHAAEMQRIRDEGLEGAERANAEAAATQRMKEATIGHRYRKAARIMRLRQLLEGNRLAGPYFPLSRFGDYTVAIRDRDDKLVSFSRFEKPADARWFAKQARATWPAMKVTEGVLSNKDQVRGAVDSGFVADIEEILAGANAPDTLRDEIWQRYLSTLPDFSMRKRFIHRKGTPGYQSDAVRAFGSAMFHASHQMARLKFAPQLTEQVTAVRRQAVASDEPVEAGLLANEIERRHQWVMDPKGAAWAQAISSGAFIWNLSVSPAAAMVNLTQTYMLGVPILGARLGGAARAAAALGKASAELLGSRSLHLENRLKGDEKRAMDEFYRLGLNDRTQSHDLAGVGETGVEYSATRAKWMARMSFLFHHAERVNREVTALAAYRLARRQGQGHEAAVATAAELTWLTHFDYSNSSRARYMQTDVAKVIAIHKQHSLNMTYRLFRDLHQMVRGESPEARRIARTQFLGVMGMHALMAGVKGLPFYGIAMVAAGLLKDAFGDDDDERTPEDLLKKWLYEAMPRELADVVLYGGPSVATGASIYNRVGFPDLFFRSPNKELEGRAEAEYWIAQILGAGFAIPVQVWAGVDMIRKGDFARGVENMLPKFVRDVVKSGRYAREGALTFTGDPILDEMRAWEMVGQAIGFTPFRLSVAYDERNAKANLQTAINNRRARLMNRYALAWRNEDQAGMDELLAEFEAFNEAYPEKAITPDTVRRSIRARMQRSERNQGGIVLDRRLDDRINEELGLTAD